MLFVCSSYALLLAVSLRLQSLPVCSMLRPPGGVSPRLRTGINLSNSWRGPGGWASSQATLLPSLRWSVQQRTNYYWLLVLINVMCCVACSCQPLSASTLSLCPRKHDFVLPSKDDKNFIPGVLYSSILNRYLPKRSRIILIFLQHVKVLRFVNLVINKTKISSWSRYSLWTFFFNWFWVHFWLEILIEVLANLLNKWDDKMHEIISWNNIGRHRTTIFRIKAARQEKIQLSMLHTTWRYHRQKSVTFSSHPTRNCFHTYKLC